MQKATMDLQYLWLIVELMFIGLRMLGQYRLWSIFQKATKVKLDGSIIQELRESKTSSIPYAYVEGEVIPVNQALYSHHVEGRSGVIHHLQMTEHKSKSVQGIW